MIMSLGLIISSGFLACLLPVWHYMASFETSVSFSTLDPWTQPLWCLWAPHAPETSGRGPCLKSGTPTTHFQCCSWCQCSDYREILDAFNSLLIQSFPPNIRRAPFQPTELVTTWEHLFSLTYMNYLSRLGFLWGVGDRIATN